MPNARLEVSTHVAYFCLTGRNGSGPTFVPRHPQLRLAVYFVPAPALKSASSGYPLQAGLSGIGQARSNPDAWRQALGRLEFGADVIWEGFQAFDGVEVSEDGVAEFDGGEVVGVAV